jgi:hypothetical protein
VELGRVPENEIPVRADIDQILTRAENAVLWLTDVHTVEFDAAVLLDAAAHVETLWPARPRLPPRPYDPTERNYPLNRPPGGWFATHF